MRPISVLRSWLDVQVWLTFEQRSATKIHVRTFWSTCAARQHRFSQPQRLQLERHRRVSLNG